MKLKFFDVSPELVAKMNVTGNKIKARVLEGLPKDAKIIRVDFNNQNYNLINVIRFVVESEEFDDLPEGASIPGMQLVYSTCLTKKRGEL